MFLSGKEVYPLGRVVKSVTSPPINNRKSAAARYKGEESPRPDLPQREVLEKTSRRFAIKYLLAVMNSSVLARR